MNDILQKIPGENLRDPFQLRVPGEYRGTAEERFPFDLEGPFLVGMPDETEQDIQTEVQALETGALTEALEQPAEAWEDHEHLPDEAPPAIFESAAEFDPYAVIRPALSPEHAALTADEIAAVLGPWPSILALHGLLSQPELPRAVQAVLLGKTGRRSVFINGADTPIAVYLRQLSRLCREAADYHETELGAEVGAAPLEGEFASMRPPPGARAPISAPPWAVAGWPLGVELDSSQQTGPETATADAFVVDADGKAYFTTFPQLGDLTIRKATVLSPAHFESLMDHVLSSDQKNFVIDAHGDPSGLHMPLTDGTKISATKQSFFMLAGIERIRTLMRLSDESNSIWERASGTDLDKWRQILKTMHSETWHKMIGDGWPTETPSVATVAAAKNLVQSRISALVNALFPGGVSGKQARVDRLIKRMLQLQAKGIREIQFRACNIGKDSGTLHEFRKFFGADHLCAPDVRSGIGPLSLSISRGGVDALAKNRLTQVYDLPSGRFAIRIEVSGRTFKATCAATTQASVGEWVTAHLMAHSRYRNGAFPIHFLQTEPRVFALDAEYAAHIKCRSSFWEGAVRAQELEEEEAHRDEEAIGAEFEEKLEFDLGGRPDAIETEDESEAEGVARPAPTEWPMEWASAEGESPLSTAGAEESEEDTALEYDTPPMTQTISDAVDQKDWPRVLELAIRVGWHDENRLTNLLFFSRHPELERRQLDPKKNKQDRKLAEEWIQILKEVRPGIQKAAEDTTLEVSGRFVAERDPELSGEKGEKFKKLVVWAAKEVNMDPGFLAAVLLAEVGNASPYLSSGEVRSFFTGTDDFFAERAQLRANVPAFAQVRFDDKKTTTNINEHGRKVTSISYNTGRDAALATAVYLKWGEIKLSRAMRKNGGDFEALAVATRFVLVRIAMAAGHGGISPDGDLIRFKKRGNALVQVQSGEAGGILLGVARSLDRVLKGEDILVRNWEPRKDPTNDSHVTHRNATILASQAIHLGEWFFRTPPQGVQPEVGGQDHP